MKVGTLSTQEILRILVALEVAADVYETESNRTPLADIRRELAERAKTIRAIRARLKSLAGQQG